MELGPTCARHVATDGSPEVRALPKPQAALEAMRNIKKNSSGSGDTSDNNGCSGNGRNKITNRSDGINNKNTGNMCIEPRSEEVIIAQRI